MRKRADKFEGMKAMSTESLITMKGGTERHEGMKAMRQRTNKKINETDT